MFLEKCFLLLLIIYWKLTGQSSVPGSRVLFWKCQPDYYLAQNNVLIKRDSPFVISKLLAAHAHEKIYHCLCSQIKNKRTARMLANARKDHSKPPLNNWVSFNKHPESGNAEILFFKILKLQSVDTIILTMGRWNITGLNIDRVKLFFNN